METYYRNLYGNGRVVCHVFISDIIDTIIYYEGNLTMVGYIDIIDIVYTNTRSRSRDIYII